MKNGEWKMKKTKQNFTPNAFRKKISAFFILFFGVINIYAQNSSTIIFYDDYKGNDNYWYKIKDANVRNGKLYLQNKGYALQIFTEQIFIDYRQNFAIETSITQTSGDDSQSYGLVWGARGWENSYVFLISSSGYYAIGRYKNKKYTKIKDWTKSNLIRSKGMSNTLKIEKSGVIYNFYINGTRVHTTKFLRFFGQMTGFILRGDIKTSVEYLKVTSDKRKINLLASGFSKYKKENMGLKINSPYSEIAPIISPDGKTLYFGRIYHPDNFGAEKECDIWYSELQPDSTWGKAIHAGKPLNNDGVNVVITVSPDGNTLFLEGLYNPDGSHKSEQGISVSHRLPNGQWSVPKEIKIKNFYNKNEYETYCFSTDRSVLIMSVERDDTYGDLDLYVSFRKPDGSYTEPKNMGPVINTFASDGTPFLAPDGVTLYYDSYGKYGYGSADIFVTKRLDDTWLHWSEPKNLGPRINSYDWDTYLSLSAKGDYAYLVSSYNSFGNEDIFRIKLREDEQPEPVVLIYGKVFNKKTKRPIGSCKIFYEDLKTGKQVGIAESDPRTGEYKIILPYGKKYGFRAEANKFMSENENIDLRRINEYKEIKRNLFLTPVEVGESIVLQNVFFKRGTAVLYEESYSELDRLVDLMKRHPKMEIELAGHTENIGNKEKLIKLSQERVNTVKKYLTEHGIDAKRITGKGYGGAKPIATGQSEEERKKNRRVEFIILKM